MTKKLTTIKKDSMKKNVSFRLDEETIKFISVIAKNKKKTKTEVLTEIIRIAYVGLYSKPAIELNKIYIKLLKYDEERNKTKPKRE
jgi:hypothetical protein